MKQYPFCSKHKECQSHYLIVNKQSCNFACSECIYDNADQENKIDCNNTVLIPKALKSPEEFIIKIIQDKNMIQYLKQLSKICQIDLIKIKHELFEALNDIIQETKDYINDLIESLEKFQYKLQEERSQFFYNISFNNFEEIIGLYRNYPDDKSSMAEIQPAMDRYIGYLQSQNCSMVSDFIYMMMEEHRNMQIQQKLPPQKQITALMSKFQKQYTSFSTFVEKEFKPQRSLFISEQFFDQLATYARDRQKENLKFSKLIYVGNNDGLNSDGFWKKIDGRKNTLIICKSQNGYIFGGYTPCQWNKNIKGYKQDDKLATFLFSYNENEIYQIKSEKSDSAIYCNSEYGPIFGDGSDLKIASDFQDGYSNLGSTFALKKENQNNQNLLFGAEKPQIEECEIFELY